MGIFIPTNRRVRNRRFSYEPRYYDPEKEERLKRRIRIKSRSRARRRNPAGLIYFLVMLAMVIYVYLKLGGA